MARPRLKDGFVRFKIVEDDPDTKRYMLFMLHALGITWASGSSYIFSRSFSVHDRVILLIGRQDVGGSRKCVITFSYGCYEDYREMIQMSVSELEQLYKKEISLYGADIGDRELVEQARQEYYKSIEKEIDA